jgi:hypothetical protein
MRPSGKSESVKLDLDPEEDLERPSNFLIEPKPPDLSLSLRLGRREKNGGKLD